MAARLFFVLFALGLSGCAREAAAPARPALWKVVDSDTTIYLFGTIHMLPKGLAWTTPTLDAAIREARSLVLETLLDDPAALSATMRRLGTSPGLAPLLDRVAPRSRAPLEAAIAKSRIPAATLDRLETWAAALALASAGTRALGVSAEDGAESQLAARFKAARKPMSGLETPAEQLGFFDRLPEHAQRQFLASVAEDGSDLRAEFDAMVAAWAKGDIERIALTFDDELALSRELSEALLTRRNARWADWIARRMQSPGKVFIAVGAGHLAGKDSVDALIARRGLKVVRVQ